MPALDNSRHELFAQGIAKGQSQREAYCNAGYTATGAAADVNACKLLSDAKVAARVRELQERAAVRTEYDLAWFLEKGADLFKKAVDAGDHSAASQQYQRLATVAGVWVEKSESSQTIRGFSAEPVSPEEWQQRYAAEPQSMN